MAIEWGFSVLGFAIGLAVLAPNILLLLFPPRDGFPATSDAGLVFTILERAGQVGCLALVSASGATFNHPFWVWPVLTAVWVLAYWSLWVRYLVAGRSFALLYRPLGPLPVPMAVFPVLAFGSAAAWAGSIWMGIATVVLAIGHLANSWAVYRSLARNDVP